VETGWEQRKAGSSFGPLIREYYILHVVVSGKGSLFVGDKRAEFKEGDCFMVPPDIPVKYDADKNDPCKYYWVGFTGTHSKELTRESNFTMENGYVNTPLNFKEIINIVKDMAIIKQNDRRISYYLLGNLYLLFSKLMKQDSLTDNHESIDYVQQAIRFMETHFKDNISIKDVSDYVGLDRTYLFRIFKEKTSISPKEYLINIRIEEAKKLLIKTNMSINNIIFAIGYTNYVSFFNIFVAKTKQTPSGYRDSNRIDINKE
jgi:AraC-like DNA-binding protein